MQVETEFHGLMYKQFITHFSRNFQYVVVSKYNQNTLILYKCIIILKAREILILKGNSFAAVFVTFI